MTSLREKWKTREAESKRLNYPPQSFLGFLLRRYASPHVLSGVFLGMLIASLALVVVSYALGDRTRGGIACNRWIAECVFYNDLKTCIVKAYELGCPVERMP